MKKEKQMETNVEEGIAGIGSLLGLIICLFIIVAIFAAYKSGFLDGFFQGFKDVLSCMKLAKGDPTEILGCIKALASYYLGIKI